MAVGDTVYIYVGGKIGSVMFKTSVVEADLFGKGSEEDLEFFLEKPDGKEQRYMVLELKEKYPKGRFPLKDLKEHGLASVQGRSRLTPDLLQYLES